MARNLKSVKWKKIEAPQKWRPRGASDELTGYYGGKTVRSGTHGQYWVIIVHVPVSGESDMVTYLISGTVLITLIDAAGIGEGHPIKIVYHGDVYTGVDRYYKKFSLYIAEGASLPPEFLPRFAREKSYV